MNKSRGWRLLATVSLLGALTNGVAAGSSKPLPVGPGPKIDDVQPDVPAETADLVECQRELLPVG